MNYEIKCIRDGTGEYITKKTGNLTWTDTLDALGVEIGFSMAYSYFDEQFKDTLKVGDTVVVYENRKEILRGIITEEPIGSGDYKGYDFAWYLNKSETIVQFKKIAADKAIRQLCKKFEVPVGTIPNLPTEITKLYKDVIVSDVLKDILEKVKAETGQAYRLEMNKGKLDIVKVGYVEIKPAYTDETGKVISCTKACKISGARSIEDMKNHVTIAGSGENAKQIKAAAKNSSSIKKYGLLSAVETQDNITEAKARNMAKNKLKEYGKVAVSFTATMPGNGEIRAGRKIYFNRPEAGIKGWYKVKSCTHTLSNGTHWVSCQMEA